MQGPNQSTLEGKDVGPRLTPGMGRDRRRAYKSQDRACDHAQGRPSAQQGARLPTTSSVVPAPGSSPAASANARKATSTGRRSSSGTRDRITEHGVDELVSCLGSHVGLHICQRHQHLSRLQVDRAGADDLHTGALRTARSGYGRTLTRSAVVGAGPAVGPAGRSSVGRAGRAGWPPASPAFGSPYTAQSDLPRFVGPSPPSGRRPGVRLVVVVIGVILVVGVLAGTGAAVGRGRTSRGGVTALSPLNAAQGRAVFSDNFRDPGSGWTTAALPSGTTFAYAPGGYVIAARESLHHFAYTPYNQPFAQLSMAVTGQQSSAAPAGAGFGVTCLRGAGSGQIRYEFLVEEPGRWFVERRDGRLVDSVPPYVLHVGTAPAAPGNVPITVEGVCASLPDGHTTRLALFVDGTSVVTMTDAASSLPGPGWTTGLDIASRSTAPSTVTVTRFVLRSLMHLG